MDSALEEIEFLALSANRVEVLSVLSEGSYTRRGLEERIDGSQPTLGRVLRDLTNRRWIAYDGEEYTATATGQLIAGEFTALRDTVETELKLRRVIDWLPTEAMEFDLRHLTDATITIPSQTRPGAPVQRVLELLQSSTHVQIFSHAFNEQSLSVIQRRTVKDTQTFKGVFSPVAVNAIAHDSTLRQQLQELIAAESAEIRRYDGEIPLAVTITDETVHLLLRDEDGLLRAALDTDNETVLSWARERHEQYWDNSSPLTPESLSQ
jgi:predicted transcriptional regulator